MEENKTFTIEDLKFAFMKGYDLANEGVGEEHLIHEWFLLTQKLNNQRIIPSENFNVNNNDEINQEVVNNHYIQIDDNRNIKWDL